MNLITPEIRMAYGNFKEEKEQLIQKNDAFIKKDDKNAQAYFYRGCARKHLARYYLAEKDFTKVIGINNQHAPSYYKRCQAYLALGQFSQALQDANQYLKLCSLNDQHIGHFNRGICHMKMSLFDKARDDFSKALVLNPGNLLYQCYRARIAKTKEDAKRQSFEISKAIPHPIDSYGFFIRAMSLQEYGRNQAAIHCFEEAFKHDPINNLEALLQIGLCHADLNKHDQAIEVFNQLLNLIPDDSRVIQYRGMSHAANGNYKAAHNDFSRALQLNPGPTLYFERGLINYILGSKRIESSDTIVPETRQAINDMGQVTEADLIYNIANLFLALAYGQENMIKGGFKKLGTIIENSFVSIREEIKRERKRISDLETTISHNRSVLEQQNNLISELNDKLLNMEKYHQQLKNQVDTLTETLEKTEMPHSKVEQFKKEDRRLYLFYKRLCIKTEALFIAFKVIASSQIDPSTSGSKLDTAATIIQFIGGSLSLIPAFGSTAGSVAAAINVVLGKIDKERHINTAIRLSKMFTMVDMWHTTQQMAIDLTEKYRSQILEVADDPKSKIDIGESMPDTSEASCLPCCGQPKKASNAVLDKQEFHMIEEVAEFGVGLLLNALKDNRVNDEDDSSLSTQFVRCVCHGEDLGVFSCFKDSKIKTTSKKEKEWTMYGFYRKVGIETENQEYYGGKTVDTDTYGFRKGTTEEADELQLELIHQE